MCLVEDIPLLLRTFFRFVYYFMPSKIGLCAHLFLDEILKSIRLEFIKINKELERRAVRDLVNLNQQEIYSMLCRTDELTLHHSDLVSLATDFNKLYDIVTISSMITWLVSVIDAVYVLMHNLWVETTITITALVFTAVNILIYFLWFSLMVRMYSSTQNEANQTAEFVHDVWNRYHKKINVDLKTVRSLELISLRLLNHKLHFTARNFFKLDETFCHLMVAAVATYVVILFQF
ncbi:hypothetical protein Zmor_028271 [Zophobas morio]|uniref:Gustatory receptor n=1 Tax=Zophobas morio TaxID=2755281 RepID=A0AA38M446_9CUCU|nr:hypothetical protein Zmor_028271 [Zophobas morio]